MCSIQNKSLKTIIGSQHITNASKNIKTHSLLTVPWPPDASRDQSKSYLILYFHNQTNSLRHWSYAFSMKKQLSRKFRAFPCWEHMSCFPSAQASQSAHGDSHWHGAAVQWTFRAQKLQLCCNMDVVICVVIWCVYGVCIYVYHWGPNDGNWSRGLSKKCRSWTFMSNDFEWSPQRIGD